MYTELVVPIHEYLARSMSFTIHKEIHTYKDGDYVGSRRDSMGFSPDQLEDAKAYLGDPNHPIIAAMKLTWTPEIVAAFEAKKLEQKAREEAEAKAQAELEALMLEREREL